MVRINENEVEFLINDVLKSCKELEDLLALEDTDLNNQISNNLTYIIKQDFINYICCLSDADQNINSFEKEYYNWVITSCNCVHESVSVDLLNNVPNSLKIMIEAENYLVEKGVYLERADQNSPSIKFFLSTTALGAGLLISDSSSNQYELQVFINYTKMIKRYIQKNLKRTNLEVWLDINSLVASYKTDNNEKNEDLSHDSINCLDSILIELNSLVGLNDVKKYVNSLINLVSVQKMRQERGLKEISISLHMVFSGNPGTGKTTVARLLAKIFRELGVISEGHLVEVDRSGLVAGYVGQTAIKVKEAVKKAIGGVLFVDEAYSLAYSDNENDFGREAIDILVKEMEDNRDNLIVIVAGYPDLMENFINSNPGLRSRFNKYVHFPDYTPNELLEIFDKMCKEAGYIISSECIQYTRQHFTYLYSKRDKGFGNARMVRNYFETAITNQANRVCKKTGLTNDELLTLEVSDVK